MAEKLEKRIDRLEFDIKMTLAIVIGSIIGFVATLSYNGII